MPAPSTLPSHIGCWPSGDQTMLLRAALLEGDEARAALDAWRRRCPDLSHIDRGSRRLLPLLHGRVSGDDLLAARVEAEYNETTSRWQTIAAFAGRALATLQTAGIDTALLKGAALVARGDLAPGFRPMADADVLVHERQALEARDALLAAGWCADAAIRRELLTVQHAVHFRGPRGEQVDLHWHVLAERCDAGSDEAFWSAMETVHLDGRIVLTLCPTDMLLHTCVHGLQWSIVPPVRWVADACLLLRRAPIDWRRLVDHACERMLVLPLRDGLTYLRSAIQVDVPDDVIDRLARVAVPDWAHAEHRIRMQPRSLTRQIRYHWLQHRRLRGHHGLVADALHFPDYVRRRFGPQPFGRLARRLRQNPASSAAGKPPA